MRGVSRVSVRLALSIFASLAMLINSRIFSLQNIDTEPSGEEVRTYHQVRDLILVLGNAIREVHQTGDFDVVPLWYDHKLGPWALSHTEKGFILSFYKNKLHELACPFGTFTLCPFNYLESEMWQAISEKFLPNVELEDHENSRPVGETGGYLCRPAWFDTSTKKIVCVKNGESIIPFPRVQISSPKLQVMMSLQERRKNRCKARQGWYRVLAWKAARRSADESSIQGDSSRSSFNSE